jgi:hypothetical protein
VVLTSAVFFPELVNKRLNVFLFVTKLLRLLFSSGENFISALFDNATLYGGFYPFILTHLAVAACSASLRSAAATLAGEFFGYL